MQATFVASKVSLDDFDTSSRAYTIQRGERFLARNASGHLLLGTIIDIKDDTRGADQDEVVFDYLINVEPSSEIRSF